jgi:protoporphyrinogen oxidase
MTIEASRPDSVVVIGGGFEGLAAAWELARRGVPVTLLDADSAVGGLAGGYEVCGGVVEKFYHHWFNHESDILQFIKEMGLEDHLEHHATRTGFYYENSIFRLSEPTDVLRFKALSFYGRLRLGLLAVLVRTVRNWKRLEGITARDWLVGLGGKEVYRVVWEPLLRGKFGRYAEKVSAAWFWKKVAMRSGSRGKAGQEVLIYFRGGFLGLAKAVVADIEQAGGKVLLNTTATGLDVSNGKVAGVRTEHGVIRCSDVIATTALPIIADILDGHCDPAYIAELRGIEYLASFCVVLQLDRSLSKTYWLNVNDASFPFVGIIEHTNFESEATYGGRHIVYLAKYLPRDEMLYQMTDDELLDFSVPYVQRIFPEFNKCWILDFNVWRADYAQPMVGLHHSKLLPETKTPLPGVYIATMAQIYPVDRGTSLAVRDGRRVAALVASERASRAAAARDNSRANPEADLELKAERSLK